MKKLLILLVLLSTSIVYMSCGSSPEAPRTYVPQPTEERMFIGKIILDDAAKKSLSSLSLSKSYKMQIKRLKDEVPTLSGGTEEEVAAEKKKNATTFDTTDEMRIAGRLLQDLKNQPVQLLDHIYVVYRGGKMSTTDNKTKFDISDRVLTDIFIDASDTTHIGEIK